ncbi:MAG: HAD-IIIA family hydrolase [Flavobacteriales bacterium]|nr:HAD-IIIA family hydrolase [Flavobacteriales bacterium]MCX7767983.1 HAD-IIIA family hydrolase [Flavobacteriales bacterium]MDW8409188.1 HAD-IIIA family hydrolase [Flavobacteriales bacterium]
MEAILLSHKVKLLVCDVDGTLTDGRIHITASGEEFKSFNARDGLAMARLNRNGLPVALLSHSHAFQIVRRRAEILGLSFWYAGTENKSEVLNRWLHELGIEADQVLYLGDDLNDLDAMKMCGWRACPADACPQVKAISQIRLSRKGGDGVFRELAEKYFSDLLLGTSPSCNVS